jgi:uncharacterized protein YpiB (UPF0302 family)
MKMAKRISINDWVETTHKGSKMVGYVVAKDKGVCKVVIVRYEENGEWFINKKVKTMFNQKFLKNIEEDRHEDDLKQMIDLALFENSKRDFNKYARRLAKLQEETKLG